MARIQDLQQILARIDGRGYKAYKDIAGRYDFGAGTLCIDHVQGDPFAAPSRIRVRVPQAVAQLPDGLYANAVRRVALQDFLARMVQRAIQRMAGGRRGSGKSGLITVDAGGQEVLERTAVVVLPEWVEVRLHVGLPAAGRSVLGRQAEALLCTDVVAIVQRSLHWAQVPQAEAQQFVECVENQEDIRAQLDGLGLVAFVAEGAILPRESGASDRPLPAADAILFRSPDILRVTLPLRHPIVTAQGHQETISGMGIPQGVTLIVGGGYHGKSTLLQALERCVYAHTPGDGREYVVTRRDAVKIRAEDGRRVAQVDISPFINNLPYGRSTTAFATDNASGSTSQAANIIEALEVGTTLLLLDEDTSATNFMVRDARMQALVHREHEPITPFLDRVRALYEDMGVSSVLVMGGAGDYFDVADTVIMLRDYVPSEVSAEVREIIAAYPSQRRFEATTPLASITPRVPLAESFDPSRGRRDVKIDAKGLDLLLFGSDAIDLHSVEQLVDVSQTRAVGYAIYLATTQFMDGKLTLAEVLTALAQLFDADSLDGLDPFRRRDQHPGNFARPRPYEIAAAINRLRTVQMRQRM